MKPSPGTLRTKLRVFVTVGAVGALVLSTASTAVAAHSQPDNVCPAPDGNESFDDVSDGTFANTIECMAGYGIAEGYPDDTYRPDLDITRGQMAQFIFSLVETARPGTLDEDADNPYDDVEDGATFENAISALTEAGVVDGTSETTYEPGRDVKRGEMAKFIHNAIEAVTGASLVDSENSTDVTNGNDDEDAFPDDDGSVFEDLIDALAADGIVTGETGGDYNPAGNVNRGQMSAFIMRAGAFLEDVGMWNPQPAEARTLFVQLSELNGSGGNGNGTLTVNPDGTLTVNLQVSGLEDAAHAQHIHGFEDQTTNSTCPTDESADQIDGVPEEADNPDDFVALEEGADEYGPVLRPLSAADDASDFSGSTGSSYTYTETFEGRQLLATEDLDALQNRAIVVHGMTVDGTYAGTLPVLCGQISTQPGGDNGGDGTGDVFNVDTGEFFNTIQAAIDDADTDAEDTIQSFGDEAEDVTVDKAVTLTSQGTTLDGSISVTADDVTVDGFEITGFGNVPGDDNGAIGVSGENVTITGNSIDGDSADGDGPRGISTDTGTTGGTLDGNAISDVTTGVFLQGNASWTISGNEISRAASGIATDVADPSDVSITGNTLADNAEGIGLGGPDVEVTGNTFTTTDPADDVYVEDFTGFYDLEDILAENTFTPEGEVDGDQIVPIVG